jgi:hypothetical protein
MVLSKCIDWEELIPFYERQIHRVGAHMGQPGIQTRQAASVAPLSSSVNLYVAALLSSSNTGQPLPCPWWIQCCHPLASYAPSLSARLTTQYGRS